MNRSLYKCTLFKGLEPKDIDTIMSSVVYSQETFSKGDVLALQGSRMANLTIVCEGSVSAETTDRFQNTIKLEKIQAPGLVAPDHLFAENNKLPVNLTARNTVVTISIPKDDFCRMMCSQRKIMENFLCLISSPNRLISGNVVYMTYKTIKGKFANYVLDRMEENGSQTFRNELTQREMAELFGVTRPALARAIRELADEGTIFVKGKQVTVLFTEKLRQWANN